jgi:hypothetical protein
MPSSTAGRSSGGRGGAVLRFARVGLDRERCLCRALHLARGGLQARRRRTPASRRTVLSEGLARFHSAAPGLAAQGTYLKILRYMWNDSKDQCSIANNDELSTRGGGLGVPVEGLDAMKFRTGSDPIIAVENGFLVSRRLKAEAAKQRKYRRQEGLEGRARGSTAAQPALEPKRQPEPKSSSSSRETTRVVPAAGRFRACGVASRCGSQRGTRGRGQHSRSPLRKTSTVRFQRAVSPRSDAGKFRRKSLNRLTRLGARSALGNHS